MKNVTNNSNRKSKHPKLFERKLKQVFRIKDVTYARSRICT